MLPNRLARVAESIRESLSIVIQTSLKDPGIPSIFTITNVEVSPDLREARVHFSQLPDDEESVRAARQALGRASGYLRRELGQRLPLKYLPNLTFFFDPTPQRAQKIEALLNQVRREDEARSAGGGIPHDPTDDSADQDLEAALEAGDLDEALAEDEDETVAGSAARRKPGAKGRGVAKGGRANPGKGSRGASRGSKGSRA